MKHSKTTKAMALMLSLVMITSVFVGNTLSRYVTSVSSTDNARVAVWGINGGEDTVMNLFDTKYLVDDKEVAKANDNGDGTFDKIMAPGTSGEAPFSIINFEQNVAPEVAYEVKISLDDSTIADEIKNNPSVQWKLDNGSFGTWEQLKTSILSLAGNETGKHTYGPGEFATAFQGTQEHKIIWQWILDNNNNVMDTEMGNLALTNDLKAVIKVSITAQQVDDLVTNEYILDGANQIVSLNNIESITIRSSADFNTFESVEVNDIPLTRDVDYTAEEGSTVITLTEEYLSSLIVGTYTIDIISNDITATTKFIVVDKVVSGEKFVFLNDDEIDKNNIKINLSSNSINDFSDIDIIIQGKNWLNEDIIKNKDNYTYKYSGYTYTEPIQLLPNTTYTISTTNVELSEPNVYFVLWYSDDFTTMKAKDVVYPISNSYANFVSFTTTSSGLIRLGIGDSHLSNVNNILNGNWQIELGSGSSIYEHYRSPKTLNVNTDGSVSGINDIYSNMIIYTMTDDIEISCFYNKFIKYPLTNTTIVNFGDSITHEGYPSTNISKYIADFTNAKTYNIGFGSTSMSYNIIKNFSFNGLVSSIIDNDFSVQEGDLDGKSSYYPNTLNRLKSIDFNDVDIITISYGINDFYNGVILDNDTNKYDETTFAGSLRSNIEKLLSKYPNLNLVICTPTYASWDIDNDTDNMINKKNNTMQDYINVINEIGNDYNLLIIDNYNNSGINVTNKNIYFSSSDGVHPNEEGRKVIAENMAKELYNYFK